MRVWLLKDGENLPIQDNVSRMRTWVLADALMSHGHQVTWWSSTHSHQRKQLLYEEDQRVAVTRGFQLILLAAGRYDRNRSLDRVRHHSRLAKRFLEVAESESTPDMIVVSFPIPHLLKSAVTYGQRHGVPVVVDVRDPWPDALVNIAPAWSRLILFPVSLYMHHAIGRKFRSCSGITACSSGFLEWALKHAHRGRNRSDAVFHLGRLQTVRQSSAPDREGVRSRLGLPAGATLFTFVGSFGHVYDLETVCEAARLAQAEGQSNIHVLLVGDGHKYETIKRCAERIDNVTLTGWLGASEVMEILVNSDVGLAPCVQMPGCLPNKIAEYASAGLPILSSLRGDMVDLLESYGAGFSYESGDPQTLFERMKALAADPQVIEAQRDGCAAMFRKEFDASRIYPRFVKHLERVATSHQAIAA